MAQAVDAPPAGLACRPTTTRRRWMWLGLGPRRGDCRQAAFDLDCRGASVVVSPPRSPRPTCPAATAPTVRGSFPRVTPLYRKLYRLPTVRTRSERSSSGPGKLKVRGVRGVGHTLKVTSARSDNLRGVRLQAATHHWVKPCVLSELPGGVSASYGTTRGHDSIWIVPSAPIWQQPRQQPSRTRVSSGGSRRKS
jgi:hypothetical protein